MTKLRRLFTQASGVVRAAVKVLNLGGRTAYVQGEVHDGDGKLAAHAVGNFSIVGAGRA